MINKDLINYIETNILPIYSTFDGGHNENHIREVLSRSLEYYEKLKDKYKLNINIVYTVACLHDIGMKVQRENHAHYSSEFVLKDDNLKRWFNKKELLIISEAVNDHSTSSGHSPRSIYGKIVSDADKDTDIEIGLLRGWNYSLKNFPTLTIEERIDEIHSEVVKRFGDESVGGKDLVKFYLPIERSSTFMKQMKNYAYNKQAFKEKMLSLINKQ